MYVYLFNIYVFFHRQGQCIGECYEKENQAKCGNKKLAKLNVEWLVNFGLENLKQSQAAKFPKECDELIKSYNDGCRSFEIFKSVSLCFIVLYVF